MGSLTPAIDAPRRVIAGSTPAAFLTAPVDASRRAAAAGFTLVELLVVLIVVGIAASIIIVNLGHDERRDMQREAKRLAATLEHAAAMAQWSSATLGVSAEGRLYRFWRREAGDQWAALAGDEVLVTRVLPAGITVAPTSYAGTPLPPDAIVPFRASGRNEPYEITLSSDAGSVVVSADPLNRVAFSPLMPALEFAPDNRLRDRRPPSRKVVKSVRTTGRTRRAQHRRRRRAFPSASSMIAAAARFRP